MIRWRCKMTLNKSGRVKSSSCCRLGDLGEVLVLFPVSEPRIYKLVEFVLSGDRDNDAMHQILLSLSLSLFSLPSRSSERDANQG